MKCYHCNENEAQYRFFVNFMGQYGEVYICQDCLTKIRRYTSALSREKGQPILWYTDPVAFQSAFSRMGFAAPEEESAPEEDFFPVKPEEGVRRRRTLNVLRARLQSAIDKEDYESAATIRDEIKKMQEQEGVCIYDT